MRTTTALAPILGALTLAAQTNASVVSFDGTGAQFALHADTTFTDGASSIDGDRLALTPFGSTLQVISRTSLFGPGNTAPKTVDLAAVLTNDTVDFDINFILTDGTRAYGFASADSTGLFAYQTATEGGSANLPASYQSLAIPGARPQTFSFSVSFEIDSEGNTTGSASYQTTTGELGVSDYALGVFDTSAPLELVIALTDPTERGTLNRLSLNAVPSNGSLALIAFSAILSGKRRRA